MLNHGLIALQILSVQLSAQHSLRHRFLRHSVMQNKWKTEDLELPQVSLSSLNKNQRAIVSLVLHTLYNFVENQEHYHPLRLVVSGTAETG